jgi:hypothetical protein
MRFARAASALLRGALWPSAFSVLNNDFPPADRERAFAPYVSGAYGFDPAIRARQAKAAKTADFSPPRRLISGKAGEIDDLADRRIHRHDLNGPLHPHQERPYR